MFTTQNQSTENHDSNQLLYLLERLETAKQLLEQTSNIDETLTKLDHLEFFLKRFGTLKELTSHLLFIEKKMYTIKEYFTVQEAADYLCLSSSLIYKLTSKHELPVYKPNGKTIYIKRDDLNNWISRHKVLSDKELEAYAAKHMKDIYKKNNKNSTI